MAVFIGALLLEIAGPRVRPTVGPRLDRQESGDGRRETGRTKTGQLPSVRFSWQANV
jgi:hypothetical protein